MCSIAFSGSPWLPWAKPMPVPLIAGPCRCYRGQAPWFAAMVDTGFRPLTEQLRKLLSE